MSSIQQQIEVLTGLVIDLNQTVFDKPTVEAMQTLDDTVETLVMLNKIDFKEIKTVLQIPRRPYWWRTGSRALPEK